MTKTFRQLDLNLLRVLVTLQRLRSVTAAGESLSLSQPATSNALARLRRHFDDALFVRASGGLVATPLALRLATAAAKHLEALERDIGTPAAFDAPSSTRTWRLSLSDLGEMVFLPAIANAVLAEAPRTHIVNAAVSTARLGDALAQREVDLAIGILDAARRGLRSASLFSETYVALSDPAQLPRQRTLAGLARCGLIVASPTATFHGGVEASLKQAGLGERIVMRVRHFAAMPDLVQRAPLVGIVPHSWAADICRGGALAWWPLPLALPEYDVRLVWHGVSEGDPALDWLRAVVLRLFRRS
jgi:DNA-binding transcriptional LysR family regulator